MMKNILNNKWLPIVVALVALLVYYVPFLVLGDNSYIRILDCLDNDVAHWKMIVDQHAILDYDQTLPLLYGIPRSEFIVRFLPIWLFYLVLPPFWAFVANDFSVRLIALVGMYLLLTRVVLPKESSKSRWIAAAVSVLFAYISFYTIYGLSAAGLPMLIYAFANLQKREKIGLSYLLILLFTVYSHLELIGVFAGLVLGIYYLIISAVRKDWHWPFFAGLCVLGVGYLFSCWDLVMSFLFPADFVSHRIEFSNAITNHDIYNSMKDLIQNGHMHSGLFRTQKIWYAIIPALGVLAWKRKLDKPLCITMLAMGITLVLYLFAKIMAAHSGIVFFRSFQFDRFYFFMPMLWMLLFACSLSVVTDMTENKWGQWLSGVFAVLITLWLLLPIYNANPELKTNIRQLQGKTLGEPNYHQLYDTSLFDAIAADIPMERAETKVVSLGIHPAVAQYNGFHTLDGYWDMYRLEYKHQFREVIAAELDKSEEIRNYFDKWGNRCYLFSAELGREYIFDKNSEVHVQHLDIDLDALRSLGCQYIFVAVPVDNYEELGLTILGEYETADSYRKIIVYDLKNTNI